MASRIGEANIGINIDLRDLTNDIAKAVTALEDGVGKIRKALDIKPDGDGLDKTEQDIKDVGKSADKSAEDVKELGTQGEKSIDKLLKMDAVRNAIQGLKTAFREMKDVVLGTVESFADAELTVDKLRGGLEQVGDGNYLDKLVNQASVLQSTTPFSDDDIVNMQGLLTTFQLSGDAIEKLTPAMLNLSSAFSRAGDTGKGLTEVALLFGKAIGADYIGELARVGIVMTDTQRQMLEMTEGMEKVNIFLEVMSQNSSITAEAFGTTLAGKLKMAENAIDDIKEAIGEAFAPVVLQIIDAIKNFASVFTGLPPLVQGVIGVIVLLSIAVTELIAVMVIFDVTTGGLLIALGVLVTALAGLVVVIGANMDAIKDFIVELVGGQEAFDELKEFANDLLEKFEELWSFTKEQLLTVFHDVKQGVMDLFEQFAELFGGSDNLLAILKDLAEEGFNNLKTIVYHVTQIVKDFIQEVINVISHNASLNTSLKGSSGAWGTFKRAGEIAINMLLRMIDIAKRTVVSIMNLASALQALSRINLADAIFNPDRWEANIDQLKNAVTNIGEEFTKEFTPFRLEGNNTGDDIDNPVQLNPLTGRIDDASVNDLISTTKIAPQNTGEDKGESPGSNKGGKGSDKKEDPFKDETESLKELISDNEYLIGLLDDQIILGKATVEERQALIETYIEGIEALSEMLLKEENIRKAEEKISSLKVEQNKTQREITKRQNENNKLLAEVDGFLEKRQAKTLGSADKETLAIENAYEKMEQKITNSKLEASIQREQINRLEAEKKLELDRVAMENELALDAELNNMRLQAEHDTMGLEVEAINIKYDAERERIIKNFEEGKKRAELLMLLEQKRNQELAKAQLHVLNIASDALQNTFTNASNKIGDAVGGIFDNLFGEAQNLVTDFVKFFLAELVKLASNKVFKLIFDALSGGIFGGIGGIFSSIFKAEGGAVKKGQGYVVGEEGMEVFVPGMDGWIIPNNITESLMNRGSNINALASQYASNTIAEVPDISIGSNASGEMSVRATTSGGRISVPINLNINTLDRVDENTFRKMVDDVLIPEISDGLRRIGKEELDNSINN